MWIQITPKDLVDYLAQAQLEILQKEVDQLPNIIQDVVNQVRSEIHANFHNQLSYETYLIPKELRRVTCYLILEALQSRIPILKLTVDQIRNANNARKYLKRIADGSVPVSTPYPQNNSHRIIDASVRSPKVTQLVMKGL